jgi:hypothetical protein
MASAEVVADAVSQQPPTPPTSEAEDVGEAPEIEPSERARHAIAEVRRWIEEPPRRRDADRPRSATSAAGTPEPSLSIGTIEVTVEAAATQRIAPAAAPPPPPAQPAGRDVVPRDYLRGW